MLKEKENNKIIYWDNMKKKMKKKMKMEMKMKIKIKV